MNSVFRVLTTINLLLPTPVYIFVTTFPCVMEFKDKNKFIFQSNTAIFYYLTFCLIRPLSRHLYRLHSLFLISNFRPVLNVVCFLLGNSLASEFYMPTFRNTLYDQSSYAGRYDGTDSVF
jgi:hypothetical protein